MRSLVYVREIKERLGTTTKQALMVLRGLATVLIAPCHLSNFFEFLFELSLTYPVIVGAPHKSYEVFIDTNVLH